jgi:hypothetical protein
MGALCGKTSPPSTTDASQATPSRVADDGTLQTFRLKVSHGSCSGVWWRGDPRTGKGPPNNKRWPKNGALLKGEVVVVSGQKHLRVVEQLPKGKKVWEPVTENKWMPFDGGAYNGGRWLYPV